MQKDKLIELLNSVKNQEVSIDDALVRLENLPFEDLGYAKLDHHRTIRRDIRRLFFVRIKPLSR
jgi:pyridinium-3,5-biscarboxylic acid mononucleotide synthase